MIGISPLSLSHTFPMYTIDLSFDKCVDTARQLLFETFPPTVTSASMDI